VEDGLLPAVPDGSEPLRYEILLVALLVPAWDAHALDVFVLGRYSQGKIAYASEERDAGYQAAAEAFIDLTSIDLRWRSSSKRANFLNFSGAFGFETMRQVVLDTAHTTPRGTATLALGTDNTMGGLRIAPLAQLGIGQYALFRIKGPTDVTSQKISRRTMGAGATVSYRYRLEKEIFSLFEGGAVIGKSAREFVEVYGTAILRTELRPAAHPAILPGEMLISRRGYELTGGLMLWMNKKTTIEARYRMFRDTFEWNAANGLGPSSTTTTLRVIDIGAGIRF
jgi:hypothetical protein